MQKKHFHYLILIAVIMVIIFITTKFTNVFGSNTDWINQHTIIPEYFREQFYETGKLLPNFAFHYGGGQNIFNLSYYGLLSPLILPSYLLPFMSMATYISIVNILILFLSAILFYKFITHHFKDDSIALTSSLIFTLAAPFIFHMHRHIMFVNYMPFLIMALMGIDKFFEKKKKSLLIISVFLMIMTSYYYSVCGILVLGIYYLYRYLSPLKKFDVKTFFKDGFRFIGLILISVLMAGCLLLPTLYTMTSGRGDATSSVRLLSLFTPYLKVHKIFCGTYAIGLSIIGFVSLIYLFYTKKKWNIVIGSIITIILFLPIFRYLLNGGLYLREKCFIPFLPLLSYFTAYFLNDLFKKKVDIKKFSIILVIIYALLYYFNQETQCYLIFLFFIVVLWIFKYYPKKIIVSFYLVLAAFIVCVVEARLEDVVSYQEYNQIFSDEVQKTIDKINEEDQSYYRTNNLWYQTTVVNKIYNPRYYSTNLYSSTYNWYYLNFVRNIYRTSIVDYNYFMVSASSNILFNSFMGVKYLYSPFDPGLGYRKIDNNLYLNTNAYPLYYATDHIMSTEEFKKLDYPYQNELLLKNVIIDGPSNNSNDVLSTTKVDLNYQIIDNNGIIVTKQEDGYLLEVEEKGYLTIELDKALENKILFLNLSGLKENSCSIDNISIKINDIENVLTCRTWIYANKNNNFRYVFAKENLKTFKLEFNKGTYNISDIETYLLDYDAINNLKNDLTPMTITKMEDDEIKGNITLQKDGYLVTSLPYDEGFKVFVDGVEVTYEIVNQGFLGFKLQAGSHNIAITYQSPWLTLGKFISLLGFIIFGSIVFVEHQKRKNKSFS